IRRRTMRTDIDRRIVSVILRGRIITPRRIPVAVVPVIVTATDQLDPVKVRVVPVSVVPLRMVGTEDLILGALPAFASADAVALIKRCGRDLIRSWLRTKTRVLRLDSLDRLRIRLFLRIRLVTRRVGLVSLRTPSRGVPNCACGSRTRRLIRGLSFIRCAALFLALLRSE